LPAPCEGSRPANNLGCAPILCFTDADGQVHPDTFNAIGRASNDPRIAGGATGVTMERWSAGIAVAYAMFLPVVWLTSMDTGVVFCGRDDFIAVGGYSETRHFPEGVDFLWKLMWLRKQRLTRLPACKAIASVRKFDRYGDWHYLWLMPRMIAGTLRPAASNSPAARRYWYEDR
jgi:hypothetical protein